MLYRSDRNYLEAIKCHLNALRHDKENLQILRDLSLLQIQMRDLRGYYETRRKMLSLKPTQPNNWLAFALSAHLLGSHDEALMLLDVYDKTKHGDSKFENGEMLLYKNQIIEESGKLNEALDHLNSVESQIIDKISFKERKAALLSLTAHHDSSEVFHSLSLPIYPCPSKIRNLLQI